MSSPDGARIAWSFSVFDEAASEDAGHIRVARLADGVVERTVAVSRPGTFSALAVDDDGTVTLATTRPPSRLVVGVAAGDSLVRRLELDFDA